MKRAPQPLATLIVFAAACSQGGSRAEVPLSHGSLTAGIEPVKARPAAEIIAGEIQVIEDTDLSLLDEGPPQRPFVRITTPLLQPEARSLEIGRTVWAKSAPFEDSPRLGLIRKGTRIAERSHVNNDECETPWIEVAPGAFACVAVEPSDREPTKKRDRKRPLIGRYAIGGKGARFYKSAESFAAGDDGRPSRGDMFRITGSVTLEDGTVLIRTERREYIESDRVRRLWGSRFSGVDLTADDAIEPPFAFAVHPRNPRRRVLARQAPEPGARIARRLKAREVVLVNVVSGDFVRIGDDQWVARSDLRVIEDAVELPDAVAEAADPAGVRWADVDLDQQLVVIYQGRRPIFATLTSSGRGRHETPTGVYRVTRKKIRTTMRSDRSKRQSYSVAVPWSVYFHEGYAFHTAYWHNSFGKPRSHGCLNLAPADALAVYKLLGPELPAGWTVVYGHDSHQPGSLVRVRSAEADAETDSESDNSATSQVAAR